LEAVSKRYSSEAITLHWLTALLIFANLLLGLSMVDLPLSPRKLQWYLVHKTIGVTVFILTSLRLAWRLYRVPPAAVAMPAWQRRSATATHALMYVLLFAIPISGWVYSSATGVQVVYLHFPLPDLVEKDKALAAVLLALHQTLNFTLFVLVCVHALAALVHHFRDRDEVLWRMLPMIKPRTTAE
jgi:cytochrome b561